MQGIGDSGQGFANAILFVIFSKNVRQSFLQCVTCKRESDVQSSSESKKLTTSLETGEKSKQLEPSASGTSLFSEESYENEESTRFQSNYGTVN